jgi:hypothetical protein
MQIVLLRLKVAANRRKMRRSCIHSKSMLASEVNVIHTHFLFKIGKLSLLCFVVYSLNKNCVDLVVVGFLAKNDLIGFDKTVCTFRQVYGG